MTMFHVGVNPNREPEPLYKRATVSASVDANTTAVANAYIRNAGLTPNELIKSLWESIANTGVVPEFNDSDNMRRQARMQAFQESQELIATLPHGTRLDAMSWEDMREELEHRDPSAAPPSRTGRPHCN